jgi:hypothetical protein
MCKFDFKWFRSAVALRRFQLGGARRRHDRAIKQADLIFAFALRLVAVAKIGPRISVVALAPLSCSGAAAHCYYLLMKGDPDLTRIHMP